VKLRLPPSWGTAAGWVLVSAPVGLLVGALWAVLSPRVEYRVQGGEAARVSAQPEQYFGSDLTLGALLLVAGLVAAVVWAARVRRRWVATVVGLALGGALAGVIAAEAGQWATRTTLSASGLADGVILTEGLRLRSPALLAWWPCIAAVVVGVVVVWNGGEGLGRRGRLLLSEAGPPAAAPAGEAAAEAPQPSEPASRFEQPAATYPPDRSDT
jgi:hypothetical protein